MDLISEYQLERADIDLLMRSIESFLQTFGVRTTFVDMGPVIETKLHGVYQVSRAHAEEDAHHETCVSDGLDVWMHDEIEHVGGECSRLYDLLHVGCGHLFQWAADSTSGLKFFGDEAWAMASRSFLRAPSEEIELVWEYEREAAQLANGNLARILALDGWSFSPGFGGRVQRMFNDYAVTDLDYITTYYRTGEVRSIFDAWRRDSRRIPPIALDFSVRPVRRSNKCVALLSRRD